jgi:hypothetical protein
VKQAIIIILLIGAFAGGIFWGRKHSEPAAAAKPAGEAAEGKAGEAKPSEEEAEAPKVTRDTNGNVVILIKDDVQGDMGLVVTNPASASLSPELKGYGRVLDPAPLAALMNELATAQAAWTASSNELGRLRLLEPQGNASTRAIQTAEATALHDQLAVQSARERITLSWGTTITEQKDLPALIQSLNSLDTIMVRVDLPLGENLKTPPEGARLTTGSGQTVAAEYVGRATSVDPQMQGLGYLFLIRTNSAHLSAGEAVAASLKVAGEPISGVIVPRDAVVRTEGSGWVYVLSSSSDAFTRIEIPLDRPVESGWFVTNAVTANSYVLIVGPQQLLSIELKGASAE